MAAYTGTIVRAGKNGEIGQQYTAVGSFDLADGGAGLDDTDTVTWSNLLPLGGGKIVGFTIYGGEIDSNATPTATFTVGDGSDADGYLTTKGGAVGLQNSLAGQLIYKGDGALMNDASVTNRDIVLTMTAASATAAATGVLYIEVLVEGI